MEDCARVSVEKKRLQYDLNMQTDKNKVYLPESMKISPAKQAIFALVWSEPPTFVHFIPNSPKTAPKKPRQTAEIINPLQAWM